MAKARISISLDPSEAELIKGVAAEHGLDVSAFMVTASRKEAARLARIGETFADIDSVIAKVEAEAEELSWPPDNDVDPDEAARAVEEIRAARARAAAHRRGAAA